MAGNFTGIMMDGPSIEGVWQNPKTGDFFTVRDSYMEDDDFIIIATDGRRFNYKMLNDYSQTNQKIEELKHSRDMIRRKREQDEDNEVLKLVGSDEEDILTKPLKRNTQPTTQTPSGGVEMDDEINSLMGNYANPVKRPAGVRMSIDAPDYDRSMAYKQPALKDADIIGRALKRVKAPEIKLDLIFEKYPEKQLDMLVNLMGCEYEDIANWMYEEYFSMDLKSIIIDKIKEMLEGDKPEESVVINEWKAPFPSKIQTQETINIDANPEENIVERVFVPEENIDKEKSVVKKPTTKKKTNKKK